MTIPPTSWTDNNLTWTAANPLWDLMSLNLAMIESVKECDAITGRTVPVLLSAAYNPIQPNRDYVNAIHGEVTALIPLFVNHLDNSGNWNGQATIPAWTEASILTAIGDASRIVPSNLNVLSPWYFQTYKILNMLRWHSIRSCNSSAPNQGALFIETYRKTASDATWNSTAWTSQHLINFDKIGNYRLDSSNSAGSIGKLQITNSTVFEITYNIYIKPEKFFSMSNYYNEAGYIEELFNLIHSETTTGTMTTAEIGSRNQVPGDSAGYQIENDLGTRYAFVRKFDGAGGRKFKDW